MNEAKIYYEISTKDINEAIDIKNKILINTTDKEKVDIKFYVGNGF
ncbi:TPA: hypothetical protein VBO02_001712 [Streptococcus agalactiae]|nr:hypothetical protein [Streptococcus agalactiae]EPW55053.1 hypothetical protein SAG0083_05225 [Streptococcus agalactiae LMG 15084]SUN19405.1 Uncharacterised protein [Streptococcus agalactiae]HEO8101446.1 hypothetical protein [Streptococcus agalactiae]